MAGQAQYHQQQHVYHQQGLRDEQPGLETAYSNGPMLYTPVTPSTATVVSPDIQTAGTEPKWLESQPHTVTRQLPPPQPNSNNAVPAKRRILGLTVPVFWGLITALVIILAAGVAGGVAGGLSAQQSKQKSNDASSPASASDTATAAPTTATESPTSPVSAGTTTSSMATARVTALAGGVLPAPTDGGCPSINMTTYTPTDASGKPIGIDSGQAQSFRQLCEVNYPSGASWGNPDLYDILKIYVSTFEECMTLCASHNQAYALNLAAGRVASGGYCRSVAMIKQAGEYCYLKNGTGKVDTQGHAKDFISAVVIAGLTAA
ncbi:hypothetical protein CSOJ01_02020 [Colletotrichum sojae]|uniref:Apple domain-containing protein n=1 Tax=Colletotrichum sojae TaxID=2175907 RepID=A0A8H6JRR0_9PEZI|nr:hypothetical protein CSOJ01_02020 [Colletotrichum sojae]